MSDILKSAIVIGGIAIVVSHHLATRKAELSAITQSAAMANAGDKKTGQSVQTRIPSAPKPTNTAYFGPDVILTQGDYGHFYTNAQLPGGSVSFVVDTGASMVVLTAEDAERAGIFVRRDQYTVQSSTANGVALNAPVRLSSIRINNLTVYDVDAMVAEPGALTKSLLGMSFLKKLGGFDVSQGRMVLKQ